MVRRTPHPLIATIALVCSSIACDSEEQSTTSAVEHALSARVPAAAPPPASAPAEPTASAEPAEEIVVPAWVDEYATSLCKRVGVCRAKMLAAVPPRQKQMLSMQIPSQEACFENTRTFKEEAPKAELDDDEKKALASCLKSVPSMACGDVQTGKVPECQPIADLIAKAQGKPTAQVDPGAP